MRSLLQSLDGVLNLLLMLATMSTECYDKVFLSGWFRSQMFHLSPRSHDKLLHLVVTMVSLLICSRVHAIYVMEGFAPLPRTESKASLGRTPSLATQNSVGSTVSNLLRRATSSVRMTKRAAVDRDDVSLASRISRPGASRPIPQLLNRQTSNSSLASESTRHIPFDLRSVSSRRSGKSTRTFYDMTDPNRQGTLSTRRGEPPSSFATKHMYNWQNTANDTLQTASELRAEIRSTESEQRRLLDAFNGLELSAFTGKPQHTMMDIESSTNVTVGRLAAVSPTLPQHLKLAESVSVVRQQELLNSGVDEIRRRREEVRERYRQRIDYLRAKLKSAEIRERVLRK